MLTVYPRYIEKFEKVLKRTSDLPEVIISIIKLIIQSFETVCKRKYALTIQVWVMNKFTQLYEYKFWDWNEQHILWPISKIVWNRTIYVILLENAHSDWRTITAVWGGAHSGVKESTLSRMMEQTAWIINPTPGPSIDYCIDRHTRLNCAQNLEGRLQ